MEIKDTNFLKDLDTKDRFKTLVASVAIIGSLVLTAFVVVYMNHSLAAGKQEVYLLDNNNHVWRAVRAFSGDYRAGEYREVVEAFHRLFFTQQPNKTYIDDNMNAAFKLVGDKSAWNLYQLFRSNRIFETFISGNVVVAAYMDSIHVDLNGSAWEYFGHQTRTVDGITITLSIHTQGTIRDNLEGGRSAASPNALQLTNIICLNQDVLKDYNEKSPSN